MADESKKNNFQNTVDSLFKGMDGFLLWYLSRNK